MGKRRSLRDAAAARLKNASWPGDRRAQFFDGREPAAPEFLADLLAGEAGSLVRGERDRGHTITQADPDLALLSYPEPDNDVLFTRPSTMGLTTASNSIVPGSLLYVVVGDLAKVEAPVRALELGEVTRLDADGKPLAEPASAPAAE